MTGEGVCVREIKRGGGGGGGGGGNVMFVKDFAGGELCENNYVWGSVGVKE